MSDGVIAKIRKVLALASRNPSRHEAESATAKVQELLKKYGLTLSDIEAPGEHTAGNIFGTAEEIARRDEEIARAFRELDKDWPRLMRELDADWQRMMRAMDADWPRLMREMDAELSRVMEGVPSPLTMKEGPKTKPVRKKKSEQARRKRAK
jgi:hypothetical protein